MIRIRPLNQRENSEGASPCVFRSEDNPQEIIMKSEPVHKSFIFDYVGSESTT